jgi:Mn-containing catalase
MFYHDKKLMYDVKVDGSDPQFAQLLLEQFGGATGELTAALTYWTQSFHVENKAIRDMLQDIAIEEFSHLEMVGRMIEQLTEKASGAAKDAAFKSTLFAVRGIGPHLVDSQGQAWTSAYVNEGGNVVRDLRADIAAEAGARQTYEALVKLSPDEGCTKALTFLLTREISHTHMFMKALESLGKLTDPLFGNVRPDETVDLYFNLSKDGPLDLRGPWNSEPAFRFVEKPEPQGQLPQEVENPDDERHGQPQAQGIHTQRVETGVTREVNNPADQHRDLSRSTAERNPIK